MIDPIPPVVVTAIYAYFVVVFATGLYLHGRLWSDYRRRTDARSDRPPEAGSD